MSQKRQEGHKMALEIAGEKWRLFVKYDGPYNEITGVHSTENDNSSDDITRNFIDGTNFKKKTNFTGSLTFIVTNLAYTNLNNLAPGYVYAPGETIDGTTMVAGPDGAFTVGRQKSSSTQELGTIKLVPLVAAQAGRTQYVANATIELTDKSMDDGLLELTYTVSGDIVDGDLTESGS